MIRGELSGGGHLVKWVAGSSGILYYQSRRELVYYDGLIFGLLADWAMKSLSASKNKTTKPKKKKLTKGGQMPW